MNVQTIEDSNYKHVGMSYMSSVDYPNSNPSIYAGECFKVHSYDEENNLFICEGYEDHFALTPNILKRLTTDTPLPTLQDPILESALTSAHYLFFGLVFGLQIDDPPVQEVDHFIDKLIRNPRFMRKSGYKSLVTEDLKQGEYALGMTKQQVYDKFYEFLTSLIPTENAHKLSLYYTELSQPELVDNTPIRRKANNVDIMTESKMIEGREVKCIVRLVEDHGNPDYPNTDELMTWMEIDGEIVRDITSIFIKKGSVV